MPPANLFGTRGYLKNNYLYRWTGVVLGIYANSKAEALYPIYGWTPREINSTLRKTATPCAGPGTVAAGQRVLVTDDV